jgi:hypothetical protein
MMSVVISDGKSRIELRKLTPRQLKRLDLLLEQVGEFGAVKLVVEKGVVKFVEVTVSKRI